MSLTKGWEFHKQKCYYLIFFPRLAIHKESLSDGTLGFGLKLRGFHDKITKLSCRNKKLKNLSKVGKVNGKFNAPVVH